MPTHFVHPQKETQEKNNKRHKSPLNHLQSNSHMSNQGHSNLYNHSTNQHSSQYKREDIWLFEIGEKNLKSSQKIKIKKKPT